MTNSTTEAAKCQGVACAWFEMRSWPEYMDDAAGNRTYTSPAEGSCGFNRLSSPFQVDVPPGFVVE
jgi:hypothetical protein